jgi:hypothetical protein
MVTHLTMPTRILRNSDAFWISVRNGEDLRNTAVSLFAVSFVFFSIYGGIMGSLGGPIQAVASAIKLPVLFLLTLLICLPTLHILHLLFGSKQSVAQHAVLLLSTMAITSTLLLGFAPVAAFFMMTTQNYQFIKLLNVAIIGTTAILGVRFFIRGMQMTALEDDAAQLVRKRILNGWIWLYAFVGSQLAWTLRPFIGEPVLHFEWVRGVGGNFYVDVARSIVRLFGGD